MLFHAVILHPPQIKSLGFLGLPLPGVVDFDEEGFGDIGMSVEVSKLADSEALHE